VPLKKENGQTTMVPLFQSQEYIVGEVVIEPVQGKKLEHNGVKIELLGKIKILRVPGMMSNQGFGGFDRLRHRSPSPMASSNIMSNVTGTGLGGWNGLPPEIVNDLTVSDKSNSSK
ncbi:hypothetical protein UlMin_019372, partial [Ulmus minor]